MGKKFPRFREKRFSEAPGTGPAATKIARGLLCPPQAPKILRDTLLILSRGNIMIILHLERDSLSCSSAFLRHFSFTNTSTNIGGAALVTGFGDTKIEFGGTTLFIDGNNLYNMGVGKGRYFSRSHLLL